jgi:hypothetical protein
MSPSQALVYPFRRGAGAAWLAGIPLLLLFPLTFILVFGYAVLATRASLEAPAAAPPHLRLDGRLLRDGLLTAALVLAIALPFALVAWPLASAIVMSNVLQAAGDPFFQRAYALLAATLALALPWGLAMLVMVPPNLAAYAAGGRPADLFSPARALARVRARLLDWNLASAAIVTAWALAFAAAGLLCVGFVPGAFYAILVSAHATATLARPPPAG